MNSIRCPVWLRSTRERLIEKILKRNMDCIELFCQFRDYFSAFDEFRHKNFPVIDIRTDKRVHQNESDLR